jgi:hypothetical protein
MLTLEERLAVVNLYEDWGATERWRPWSAATTRPVPLHGLRHLVTAPGCTRGSGRETVETYDLVVAPG